MSVESLLANVTNYQYNAPAMQRAVFQELTDVTNGTKTVVDPTNPFVFAIETAVILTAGFMMKNQATNRKQYPIAAQTMEDLYPHMSDKDYVDIFATPSQAVFTMMLPEEEAVSRMIDDPVTGTKKLVIPRNTFITVADTVFSLQYPVEITQLQHGGIQVLYDASIESPLQPLETNYIKPEIVKTADGNFIRFDLELQQFNILSQTGKLNAATDFRTDIAITDQFYYARVYAENASGGWTEIKTTYTEQVYDINTPTAVIKVTDKVVNVRIPQIYTNSGMMRAGLRIDVYETKGPLDTILWEYQPSSYVATWTSYDLSEITPFTAPMNAFRTVIIWSNDVATGGTDGLTFNQLRQRVIESSTGIMKVPITDAQLENVLSKRGYQVVKNIDNITGRVLLATKGMPGPTNTKLITAAGASMETVELVLQEAAQIRTVIDNGDSITLTPDTLYKSVGGATVLVPTAEADIVNGLPVDKKALVVTSGGYLYSPFHYVLDTANNSFDSRAYYLDNPVIQTKLFVSENDTTLIQVGTETYGILRTATGYMIQVVTVSGDAYKALNDDECYVQLAFVPAGEKDYAYLNGTFAGKTDAGERIFNFDLSTNFHLDNKDNLFLQKFLMYTKEPRLTGASLTTDFDIIYSTTSGMPTVWRTGDVDNKLGRFLLPPDITGITNEKLRVNFGQALSTLWSRSRTVIEPTKYLTYEKDVPLLYEKNIYARDGIGSAVKFDEQGQPYLDILHKAGDPVLDDSGHPVYMHRVGDVVYDNAGNPTPANVKGLLRQIDVMLVDGVYWFANDSVSTTYRNTMVHTVTGWLTGDIALLNKNLLEKTRLYFYPKKTMGTISVYVDSTTTKTINAAQALTVTLLLPKSVSENIPLKKQLEKVTISIINEQLSHATVTVDGIQEALRQQYGVDVISVLVSGLGGTEDLQALTVINGSDRCSLRKRLVAQSDGSLALEEDVTFSYK